MSLRAFAVLAAGLAILAATVFGPAAALNAARWLRRRLGYEVPAPWLRPSAARWMRERLAETARHGPPPQDDEPLTDDEERAFAEAEQAARMPSYDRRQRP